MSDNCFQCIIWFRKKDDVLDYFNNFESWARYKGRKYQINGTYPCYRSRDNSSIFDWDWQWDQPTKLKAFTILFFAIILIGSATVLFILRQQHRTELATNREQKAHDHLEPIKQ